MEQMNEPVFSRNLSVKVVMTKAGQETVGNTHFKEKSFCVFEVC